MRVQINDDNDHSISSFVVLSPPLLISLTKINETATTKSAKQQDTTCALFVYMAGASRSGSTQEPEFNLFALQSTESRGANKSQFLFVRHRTQKLNKFNNLSDNLLVKSIKT